MTTDEKIVNLSVNLKKENFNLLPDLGLESNEEKIKIHEAILKSKAYFINFVYSGKNYVYINKEWFDFDDKMKSCNNPFENILKPQE